MAFGAKSKNRISDNLTFNGVFRYVVYAVAALYIVGGLLMAAGRTRIAAFFLILAIGFMLATENNPVVR